jgi:hypothetical protein
MTQSVWEQTLSWRRIIFSVSKLDYFLQTASFICYGAVQQWSAFTVDLWTRNLKKRMHYASQNTTNTSTTDCTVLDFLSRVKWLSTASTGYLAQPPYSSDLAPNITSTLDHWRSTLKENTSNMMTRCIGGHKHEVLTTSLQELSNGCITGTNVSVTLVIM